MTVRGAVDTRRTPIDVAATTVGAPARSAGAMQLVPQKSQQLLSCWWAWW